MASSTSSVVPPFVWPTPTESFQFSSDEGFTRVGRRCSIVGGFGDARTHLNGGSVNIIITQNPRFGSQARRSQHETLPSSSASRSHSLGATPPPPQYLPSPPLTPPPAPVPDNDSITSRLGLGLRMAELASGDLEDRYHGGQHTQQRYGSDERDSAREDPPPAYEDVYIQGWRDRDYYATPELPSNFTGSPPASRDRHIKFADTIKVIHYSVQSSDSSTRASDEPFWGTSTHRSAATTSDGHPVPLHHELLPTYLDTTDYSLPRHRFRYGGGDFRIRFIFRDKGVTTTSSHNKKPQVTFLVDPVVMTRHCTKFFTATNNPRIEIWPNHTSILMDRKIPASTNAARVFFSLLHGGIADRPPPLDESGLAYFALLAADMGAARSPAIRDWAKSWSARFVNSYAFDAPKLVREKDHAFASLLYTASVLHLSPLWDLVCRAVLLYSPVNSSEHQEFTSRATATTLDEMLPDSAMQARAQRYIASLQTTRSDLLAQLADLISEAASSLPSGGLHLDILHDHLAGTGLWPSPSSLPPEPAEARSLCFPFLFALPRRPAPAVTTTSSVDEVQGCIRAAVEEAQLREGGDGAAGYYDGDGDGDSMARDAMMEMLALQRRARRCVEGVLGGVARETRREGRR